MKSQMNLYYDEEGDFLEISMGDISNCFFNNSGNGIFEITDKTTNKIMGVAIFNFKKRTQTLEALKLSLPLKLEITS